MLIKIYLKNGECDIYDSDKVGSIVASFVETGLFIYTDKNVKRYDVNDIKRVFSTDK